MVEKKELEIVDQSVNFKKSDLEKQLQQVDIKLKGKIDKTDGIKKELAKSIEQTKNSLNDLKNGLKNGLKNELKKEANGELKSDVKKELKNEVKKEAKKTDVKIAELKAESKEGLKTVQSEHELKFDEKNGFKIDLTTQMRHKPIRRKETHLNNHPKKEELRAKVLEYIKVNPNDFDECDQDLLRTSDLWMNRFLNFRNQSFDSAYNQLIETFKWRKDFEINTFDKTITPIEAWMSGGIFVYLPDVNGNPVLYLRGSMHHKIEERFYKLFQKLLCLLLDNIDRLGNREFGWTAVLDLCGVGWSNVDVEMIHFLLNTSRSRYPNGCKWCIVHGLPWFLNVIAKGIFKALPHDTAAKIKFVNGTTHKQFHVSELISSFETDVNNNAIKLKKSVEKSEEEEANRPKLEIEEYIPIDNLPDFLGGRCKINYRIAPKGSLTAMKIGQTRFNLTDAKIKQLMKPFSKSVEAAHRTLDEFREANFKFEFDYENLEQEFDKYQTIFE